jgi:hypothetical protein
VRILTGDNIGHCEGKKKFAWTLVFLWMVTEIKLFEYGAHCCTVCGGVWTKGKVYKRKVDTKDKMLSSILNAAVHIKKHVDQLRQIIQDLCTQITKWNDVEGGIF